jgi:hypothetical protein
MRVDIGAGSRAVLRVERPRGIDAFLALAGDFLAAREAEHCLILGIAGNLAKGPAMPDLPPVLAVVVDERGGELVVAAALQTPPYNLVLSMAEDDDAVDALAGALAGEPLPGVIGPRDAAGRFAGTWTARTGQRTVRSMAERVFLLTALREPRPAPGRMRRAEPADRPLLVAWIRAFTREALANEEEGDVEESVERWIAGRGRSLWLWEDGDVRVSLCGAGGETPNGIRVGPVYTPPEHRGHGYASNLVAGVSKAQIDAGRRFVTLFTDLANPTSNRIYQAIGYEPVVDVDQLAFVD